jgi:hypothetical protein
MRRHVRSARKRTRDASRLVLFARHFRHEPVPLLEVPDHVRLAARDGDRQRFALGGPELDNIGAVVLWKIMMRFLPVVVTSALKSWPLARPEPKPGGWLSAAADSGTPSCIRRWRAMARYFFHLTDADAVIVADDLGEDFELEEAARGHAVTVARELMRNREPGAFGGCHVAVTDEHGVVVFRLALGSDLPDAVS